MPSVVLFKAGIVKGLNHGLASSVCPAGKLNISQHIGPGIHGSIFPPLANGSISPWGDLVNDEYC